MVALSFFPLGIDFFQATRGSFQLLKLIVSYHLTMTKDLFFVFGSHTSFVRCFGSRRIDFCRRVFVRIDVASDPHLTLKIASDFFRTPMTLILILDSDRDVFYHRENWIRIIRRLPLPVAPIHPSNLTATSMKTT